MSLHGFDIPMGKSTSDIISRREIFQIVSQYVMSAEDIDFVAENPLHLQDLWFMSFTASQKGILLVGLQKAAKAEFLNLFPSNGMIPKKHYAELLGLEFGTSMLDR